MILVDTNVLSEALRPTPAQVVVNWLDRHFSECALPTIAALELMAGATVLDPGARRDALQNAIRRVIRRFGSRVYAFDLAAAEAATSIVATARVAGSGMHQLGAKLADIQIGGIAAAYGLDLATRNVRYFQGLGLTLIDPWADGV